MILLYHADAIKQAECTPRYRVRETSTTSQPLWSRSIPWRRLLCDSSWDDVCIQWRRLHQCLQREGEGKVGPLKNLRRSPGFIKRSCNSVMNGISSLTCWNSWKRSPSWYTDRTASLRWTASVSNSCARSWVTTGNSLPNLKSTWLAFLPATLTDEPARSLL